MAFLAENLCEMNEVSVGKVFKELLNKTIRSKSDVARASQVLYGTRTVLTSLCKKHTTLRDAVPLKVVSSQLNMSQSTVGVCAVCKSQCCAGCWL